MNESIGFSLLVSMSRLEMMNAIAKMSVHNDHNGMVEIDV